MTRYLLLLALCLMSLRAGGQPAATQPPATRPAATRAAAMKLSYQLHPRTAEETAVAEVAAKYIAARYPGNWQAMRPLLLDDPDWIKQCEIRAATQAASLRNYAILTTGQSSGEAYEQSLKRTAELGVAFGEQIKSDFAIIVDQSSAVACRRKEQQLTPVFRLTRVNATWRVSADLEEGTDTVSRLEARRSLVEDLEQQLRAGKLTTRDQYFEAMKSGYNQIDRKFPPAPQPTPQPTPQQ